jgi:hypothetical protein
VIASFIAFVAFLLVAGWLLTLMPWVLIIALGLIFLACLIGACAGEGEKKPQISPSHPNYKFVTDLNAAMEAWKKGNLRL